MKSRRSKWASGIGAVLVGGGLLIASYGSGVTPASASQPASATGNPTLRWDSNYPSASRFITAFPGAVLDKNTGLVWEQAPDATLRQWLAVTRDCLNKNVGGTVGWRLPSIVELKSVQDPSLSPPFLATGAFLGVQSAIYWSATTWVADPTNYAWATTFSSGLVHPLLSNGNLALAWCVRGPMNADSY